jgi:hypothetical protein
MLIKIGDAWVDPEEIAFMAPNPDADSFITTYAGTAENNAPVKTDTLINLKHGGMFVINTTLDEAEAALIDAGYIENPYPDPEDETPELTEDERTELEAFDAQGFTWLARDADGKVFAYKEKPALEDGYYFAPGATQPVQAAGAYLFLDLCDVMEIGFLLCP